MMISVHVLSAPVWTLAMFQFPCKSLGIVLLIYGKGGLAFNGAKRATSTCGSLTLNPHSFCPRQFWDE